MSAPLVPDLDAALQRIAQGIDATSSVPVSVQLRGALEYGIAAGDIPSGSRLPSVRKLAATLRLSPVTVSNVFAALQERGQIEGRIGSGTFVTDRGIPCATHTRQLAALERQIASLVAAGRELGLSAQDIAFRVTMAASAAPRSLRIVVLGTFRDATSAYARDLSPYLSPDDIVMPWTTDRQDDLPVRIDLVVCPRTIATQAAELFPSIPQVSMILIPNEATRVALAGIRPDARVLLVSYFDDFLSVLKAGVARFAPHLGRVTAAARNADDLDDLLRDCDVLIHATGAEYLQSELGPGQTVIEYRHTPDSHAVQTQLLPALETLRTAATIKGETP
ncbi:GntR family transcriptional regulator [Paracoccus liaowanqingii]|uniref:GntR family transcriptional regulator n=1 Tax=Paracoccus liaowanqingii TaxID=2560053 RepID=A0A4Z1CLQ9_9RHOB|nr:GntR family transcriptional regulator [Paracoccus liaowanqingii]TGN61841.1 GntR family transcriptional regulator [Paracoccus liaowanqingii]